MPHFDRAEHEIEGGMPRWYALDSASARSRIAIDVGYDFLLRRLVAIDCIAGVVPRWAAR